MSEGNETDTSRCASCGIKESDDIRLKDCAACDLARYCSVACEKEHSQKHKSDCNERAAELHDEILFKHPESSHLGDCPICFLPLPIDPKKYVINTCCSKRVCRGCGVAEFRRQTKGRLAEKCTFCRSKAGLSEKIKRAKERADKMQDLVAMELVGERCHEAGDYQSAFKYHSNAAALGHVESHYQLALLYYLGQGVEIDFERAVHHFEQAAIGGHVDARLNLGAIEWREARCERGAKHWIIAAKLGSDAALNRLKMAYQDGIVSKDDLAASLRGHQAGYG